MGIIADLFTYDYDVVLSGEEYLKEKPKKTGMAGVRALFEHDEYGSPSPQLIIVSKRCSYWIVNLVFPKINFLKFNIVS